MGYFDRFRKGKYKGKSTWGKVWYFIWHEDSVESWLINIVLAFILIKFLVYPGLGFIMGTTHPIVAVVSGSMHHEDNFDEYWEEGGSWYESNGISKSVFATFPMKNGFNKGDIMILTGSSSSAAEIGDILIFQSRRPDPIIHRVVRKDRSEGTYTVVTKGDNYRTNPFPISTPSLNELAIADSQIIGKAFIRVPYLGYVKIWAVQGLCLFNKNLNFCI